MQRLLSGKSPEQHSLGVLITLIETEFPDEDVNDVENLRQLLNREFGTEFTHNDIVNHYIVSMEEEDARLQYKHLNITV